jgi:parallel beta-helix repeat protein
MRKQIILVLGFFMAVSIAFSQGVQRWTEDFDGAVSFTAQTPNYWGINTLYSTSGLNSYRGRLPNSFGDSTILETPFYDLETLSQQYGQLRFRHICKIDPADIVRLEYRINELGPRGRWQAVPADAYMGEMANYAITGFNAANYPQWQAGNLYARPEMNWWKEEVFDLYFASYSEVQFRFVIKRGNKLGTQFSYGWLIDDFQVIADTAAIALPKVSLINPVQDTIREAGPFEVNARVLPGTFTTITNVSLEYTKLYNDVTTTHSVPMNSLGQNTWQVNIPVQGLNTKIVYAVVAEDALGNKNNATSSFILVKDPSKHYDSNAVSVVSLDVPTQNTVSGGVETPLQITIRNEGEHNLTSATIHWSVNGIGGTPYAWSGNLSWGIINDQIEIGKYIPSENLFDTIVVWITDINNEQGIHSDSLTTRLFGCIGMMSGTIAVNPDTNILSKTVELLKICGVGGDITLSLGKGNYYESINLSDFGLVMGNHYLTITSTDGNRDSVILYPATTGILLNNSNNITIDKITIDASALQVPAISFTDACTNIVISNCVLLGNTTGSTAAVSPAPINKAAATGIANNIRITKNLIKGGYQGILFYGGINGNYGKNIMIDSNEFTHQYYYAIYPYYNELELSYNTIYYNKDNTTRLLNNSWKGIQVGYDEGNIIGNKIHQLSGLTTSQGMFVLSLNQFQKTPGIIANNEIIINTAGTNEGVYLSTGTNAIFAHNSVYVAITSTGTGTSTRAVYVNDNASSKCTIKNNLMVVNGNGGVAIYLGGIVYSLNHNIDYNNYYVYSSTGNIGYAGANKKTLTDWQTTVTKDIHSMNKQPFFIDSLQHLELSSYTGLSVPYLPEVWMDRNNNIRSGITSIGAYGYNYTSDDALLLEFIDWRTGTLAGNTDSIKVVLVNGGTTPLTNIEIGWNFNGTDKTPKVWAGNLAKGESATILLDEVTYSLGMNSVKAWIKDFVNDEYHANDTIYIEGDFCDTMLNGTYIVGPTGVFATVNDAMDRINTCGINGAITLALEDATYAAIDLSIYEGIQTTTANTITIKSLSGNRDNVIVTPDATRAILLGNINNLIIDSLTIDASAKDAYGIQFIDACDNIVITNCNIKARPTAIASASTAIYKYTATNLANNIVIKNNNISGGYYGIQFYAGNGVGEYGTGIVIDSNTITDAYYYSVSLYYADINSLSHNTITSRSSNTTTSWYGLYLSSVNGKINANKIRQLSTAITTPTAIYLSGFNTENTTLPGLISNNEIMLSFTGVGYGINVSGATVADIMHNSIFTEGMGTGRGIAVPNNAATFLTIKNNNLFVEGNTAYPLYLASATYISQYDIDYNNYYSTANVGYAGVAVPDLPSWRIAVPSDLHSTDYQPDFIDINTDLRIQSAKGFKCPRVANVLNDLDEKSRRPITSKGAYHVDAYALDITPNVFINLPETSPAGTLVSVEVIFANIGSDTVTSFDIHWMINGVTKSKTWNGSFTPEMEIAMFIDTVTTHPGGNAVKVWTSNPNQDNDMDASNDTLRGSVISCSAPLAAGVYTVGDDMDFASIKDVQTVLNICGIAGDVTFSVYPGTYNTLLSIVNIKGVNDTNTLSFVSHTGNPDDVTLRGVTIGANMHKVTLQNLTIDGQYSNAGVRLNTPIKDIIIDGCKIIVSPSYAELTGSTTAAGVFGIYLKGNATDTIRNIQIINNEIDGGNDAIRIEGGTSTSYGQVTDIRIDSNTLTNQGYRGIHLQYANANSVSHNTILGRTGTWTNWEGMYLGILNVSLVNANKIKQRSKSITYPRGIHLTNINNSIQEAALITNNEIYIYGNDYSYGGFYVLGFTKINFFFNSVFVDGKGTTGFMIANNTNMRLTAKYNNMFAADACYPVYFILEV